MLMPKMTNYDASNPLSKVVYGDTLIVSARTDIDGLVVSFGEKLTKQLDLV